MKSDSEASDALPDFEIAKKLCALNHGDLTRIVLVMDAHLNGMRENGALGIEILREHYNRLTDTRNKVQAVWKASLPPVPKKRKKRRKKHDPAEPFRKALQRGSLTHPAHPFSCMCGCRPENLKPRKVRKPRGR